MPYHLVGLDLGPVSSPTGLAVVEHDQGCSSVRYLHRFVPGAPYDQLVQVIRPLLRELSHPIILVDVTAVGLSIMRTIQSLGSVRPIVLTAGLDYQKVELTYRVPKRDVVTTMQLVLQQRRFKIASNLEHAQDLIHDLTNLRARTTLATAESDLDWRQQQNDDLVLAVAMCIWWADRHSGWFEPEVGCSSVLEALMAKGLFRSEGP